jgi:phage shock protein PspC (stress-responsive transcriptional regulator)
MEAAETTALIRRDDTFLGVCQALGEDFGFNPVFLRVAFAAPLIFAPVLVIETYLGLGVVVLLSRILAPRPKRKGAVQATETVETPPAEAPAPAMLAEADADQFALPMAA